MKDEQQKVFGIPMKTAPKWKFWLARIVGKKMGFGMRYWHGCYYFTGEKSND